MKDLGVLYRKPGSLPSLPTVFHHIQRVVNDPDASIEKIVKIVGEDPSLAVRLLRLANSSFYGFPHKVNTLDEAVRLIGLKQVRDLCLGTVLLDVFPADPLKCQFADEFWKHSIACGIAARLVAQYRGQKVVEQFFVMGLVHDIGKLPVLTHEKELFEKILNEVRLSGRSMFEVEREILGYDHTQVGALILNEWKMPEVLVRVVEGHHSPEKMVQGSVEVSIIHFANILVHAMGLGSSGEKVAPVFEEIIWERLELSIDFLPTICDELDRQFLEVERIFLG